MSVMCRLFGHWFVREGSWAKPVRFCLRCGHTVPLASRKLDVTVTSSKPFDTTKPPLGQ